MNWKIRKEKGISPILGALILLIIVLLSLSLILYTENQQTVITNNVLTSLHSQYLHNMIYEKYMANNTMLLVTQPIIITHIIYPNGTMKNMNIIVQSMINADIILQGNPWAVITTNQGEWFNVTPIVLPQIVNDPVKSANCGQGPPPNPGPNPNWNTTQGVNGVYTSPPRTGETISIYGNSASIIYNSSNLKQVTVDNPFWDWAVKQLESNNYAFPFDSPAEFPFSSSYFDPHGQYYYYYYLLTVGGNGLLACNIPTLTSAEYYYLPYYWPQFSTLTGASEKQETLWVNITYCYIVPIVTGPAPHGHVTYQHKIAHKDFIVGHELIIYCLSGGIEFKYYYMNVPIGVYVPYIVDGSVYYVYYFINTTEIYNLESLVPTQVTISQFRPVYYYGEGKVLFYSASSGVPTQYLHIHNYQTKVGNITYYWFTVSFTYNATNVTVNKSVWANNVQESDIPYTSFNELFTGLTVPAPPSPEITQAYGPAPVEYTVDLYPSGSVSTAPCYVFFPSTGYGGFPSFFGSDNNLPAYIYNQGMPTSVNYIWDVGALLLPSASCSYNYVATQMTGFDNNPITTFKITVMPNGTITGYALTPSYIYSLFCGFPNGNWQIASNYPIYIIVPQGVYIESVNY